MTFVLQSDKSENWRSSCHVSKWRVAGTEGTQHEVMGLVSPLLGNRMCSREVMDCPRGERPLIYALWTQFQPGSQPLHLQMGPTGRWRDAKETITPEVTWRHSLPLILCSPLLVSVLLFLTGSLPHEGLSNFFYPLRSPPNPLNSEL